MNTQNVAQIPRHQPAPKPTPNTHHMVAVGSMDYPVLLVVGILALFGIMMVFSATYATAGRMARFDHNTFYFLQRQGVVMTIGFLTMALTSRIDYHLLKRLTMPLYLVSVGLLAVAFVYGQITNGHGRWIPIPFVGQFQPSEVAKLALILVLARIVSRERNVLHTWKGFFRCGVIVGIMVVLVALGNLSTSIIIAITGAGIIFIASPHIKRFVLAGIAGVAGLGGYLVYMAYLSATGGDGGFRGGRVLAWLDPASHQQGFGYQIVNSLYAIASGGLFGLGLGQSRQKSFLPEVHNDVIFAVIVEELGFVGAGIILLLFAILVWRGLRIAMNAPDTFGALIAAGIMVMMASQVIINVAVVTNSIPNTGVPLIFISYGGTSLVVSMAAMGVLLNISRFSKM